MSKKTTVPDATPMSDRELAALRSSDDRIMQILMKEASGAKLSSSDDNDETMDLSSWRNGYLGHPARPRFDNAELAAITSESSITTARTAAQAHYPVASDPDLASEPTPCWVAVEEHTHHATYFAVDQPLPPDNLTRMEVWALYGRDRRLLSAAEVDEQHSPGGGMDNRWCLIWGTPAMGETVVIAHPARPGLAWRVSLAPGEFTPDPNKPEHTHHGLFHRH